MASVICFNNVKQAALYFDKILPVSLRKMQGTGTDILFEFPEKIPSRALVNIIFDNNEINDSDQQRYMALGQIVHRWEKFNKKTSDYWLRSSQNSLNESYDNLSIAYLENRNHPTLGSIREHFKNYASSLGLKSSSVLLPSGEKDDDSKPLEATLSLCDLELIDVGKASWEQIVEIRNDIESRKKLQRLRVFLTNNYIDKPSSYIEDDISKRLEDYDIARKKTWFRYSRFFTINNT